MAIYQKLSLSAGGGIVSTTQQAEQEKNTATILIGLGGTGVHCIRTIKTQVYSRLKPDDPNADKPTYDHIRFIGVDTTIKTRGGALDDNEKNEQKKADSILALDDTEFFNIANAHVKAALSNPAGVDMRKELSWLDYEKIDAPSMSDAGAGGIRQVGRYMMMDRSSAFMAKIEEEINKAKAGLSAPRVNIHIFAGLSGGTGSGCFLDVCYMVRSIADRLGGITTFGYCFLPDVNLSNVPMELTDVRNYIPKNGYAAMQELDYCMNLQYNGGKFKQLYQDHKEITWDSQPVDMCHLICATDKNHNVIQDAYNYAMNVTAEYIMDFLTHSDEEFGLSEHLSNFQSMIAQSNAKKVIGSTMAYCVIGAACATVPLREINTYLAAELFDKFSQIGSNQPTKADVEKLAVKALARNAQNVSDIYNSLLREIKADASDDYAIYTDDWKFVRDYGNSNMVDHYTNQTAAKLNRIEANAKSMTSMNNNLSLVGRVRTELEEIIRDLERGPVYAHRMISAAESHNMLNIIDGLIKENSERWDQEAYQSENRRNEYEKAKMDFELRRKNGLFDNDQKRFEEYEYRLKLLSQHNYAVAVYSKLAEVLKDFRKQLEDVTAGYYIKLSRVMGNLLETFRDNREALKSERIMQKKGSFEMPMMTIEELKPALDIEIEKINVTGMLDSFMALLVSNESDWLTEDEHKIAKLVTDFFVKTAFNDFSNRGITSFLKDKYKVDNDEQLSNYVYEDWMKKLVQKASPLFCFDQSVWQEDQTSKLSYLSFPATSAPIKAAAGKLNSVNASWKLKESALTDRIFVMCSACGLPLSAYGNCRDYEHKFFASPTAGIHYYEGKDVPGMKFNDWKKLTSITPQSITDISSLPAAMAKLMTGAQELGQKAIEVGIINESGQICAPDADAIARLQAVCDSAKELETALGSATDIAVAKAQANEMIAKLNEASNIPLTPTENKMRNDGHQQTDEDRIRIQMDYFVAAPAYHEIVNEYLVQLQTVKETADKYITSLNEKCTGIGSRYKTVDEFADALFTGVIALEGKVVTYHKTEFGMTTDIIMSKRGDEFPFANIPFYQGYVSYKAFDDATKADIKKVADDRYNADAPELKTAYEQLKEAFADDRMNAYAQLAQNFEQRAEIVEVLGKLKQRFGIFCMENGF